MITDFYFWGTALGVLIYISRRLLVAAMLIVVLA